MPSLSGFLLLRGKVLTPLMRHPQDKHEFTFQYLFKEPLSRSILSMLQRSMNERAMLCAIKTFNSKRHQQTWKKSKPRLEQESWTLWVKLVRRSAIKKRRVFTPPLPLLPARGLLSTKADLLTGFGMPLAVLFEDNGLVLLQFGKKESPLLLPYNIHCL